MSSHTAPSDHGNARHNVKRFGYLLVVSVPMLPWLGVMAWQQWGHADAWAWFSFIGMFIIVPILDFFLGKDPNNPDEAHIKTLADDRFYRRLTYFAVPVLALSIVGGAWGFVFFTELGLFGKIGWVMSHGLVGGTLGINVAHELIHKNTRLEKRLGDALLAMVCYPGFRIEHIYGHHRHVSTPEDRSSARFGQSLFHFLPRAIAGNVAAAFRLEALRLTRQQVRVLSFRNEVILGYLAVAAIALAT
ncbi:MAG: fatty acid desaturase, partial [Pseudomonadota bacterium]